VQQAGHLAGRQLTGQIRRPGERRHR
jgi:hypothetical protein